MEFHLLTTYRISSEELYTKAKNVAYNVVKSDLQDKIELYFYNIKKKHKEITTLAGQ